MNTFTLKGSVVSNDSNTLVIESNEDTLIPVVYFASAQIAVGSRVEIEGHLAAFVSDTVKNAVQAMANEVHVAQQLVLGGSPDEAMMTLEDGDMTLDGD